VSTKPTKVKPPVPGHKRGFACGHETNHYGNGCSKDTCLVIGTDFAKPKGYVWKSSDAEATVFLPNDVYLKQCAARPQVAENTKKARNQAKLTRKASKASVSALSAKASNDDSEESDDSESVHTSDSESSVNSQQYSRHVVDAGTEDVQVAAFRTNDAQPMDAQRPQESGTEQAVKEEAHHMSNLDPHSNSEERHLTKLLGFS
jgi:hypothetical protein